MRFEKVNLNVRLGTESTLITSFLTFAISTAISFILQKGITKYNPNKHKFIITPLYENRDNIAVYLDLIASFKKQKDISPLYQADGQHLTPRGNAFLVNSIVPSIKKKLNLK